MLYLTHAQPVSTEIIFQRINRSAIKLLRCYYWLLATVVAASNGGNQTQSPVTTSGHISSLVFRQSLDGHCGWLESHIGDGHRKQLSICAAQYNVSKYVNVACIFN